MHTSTLKHFTFNHPQHDYTQTPTHSHPPTHTVTYTLTHTHSHTHTHAHTHTRTHTWQHTHTHTQQLKKQQQQQSLLLVLCVLIMCSATPWVLETEYQPYTSRKTPPSIPLYCIWHYLFPAEPNTAITNCTALLCISVATMPTRISVTSSALTSEPPLAVLKSLESVK